MVGGQPGSHAFALVLMPLLVVRPRLGGRGAAVDIEGGAALADVDAFRVGGDLVDVPFRRQVGRFKSEDERPLLHGERAAYGVDARVRVGGPRLRGKRDVDALADAEDAPDLDMAGFSLSSAEPRAQAGTRSRRVSSCAGASTMVTETAPLAGYALETRSVTVPAASAADTR